MDIGFDRATKKPVNFIKLLFDYLFLVSNRFLKVIRNLKRIFLKLFFKYNKTTKFYTNKCKRSTKYTREKEIVNRKNINVMQI